MKQKHRSALRISFLIPVQIILTSVHLLIAAILVAEWSFASSHALAVYLIATATSFLFVTASIIVRKSFSLTSHAYYRFAMVFFGLGYVFFAGAVGGTFLLAGAQLMDKLEIRTLLALQFLLPALIAIYAFAQTARVRTRRITIALKGLPDSWDGRKIAFFSDAHFGPVYGVRTARMLLKKLQHEQADLLLIGGDFFDGPLMDFKELGREFESYAPVLGKFIVAGNHDEYANIHEARKGFDAAGFAELDGSIVEIDGVNLAGLEYSHDDNDERSLLARVKMAKKPFIILRHEPERVWVEAASAAGAMLMLSGHTHHGQLFPLSMFTRLRYGRFSYGLSKVGDMMMYTSWGIGSWGPPMRIGTDRELVIFTCKKAQ